MHIPRRLLTDDELLRDRNNSLVITNEHTQKIKSILDKATYTYYLKDWLSIEIIEKANHWDSIIKSSRNSRIIDLAQEKELDLFIILVRFADHIWKLDEVLNPKWEQDFKAWMRENYHEFDLQNRRRVFDIFTMWEFDDIKDFWNIQESSIPLQKWYHWDNDFYRIFIDYKNEELVIGSTESMQQYDCSEIPTSTFRIHISEIRRYLEALFIFGRNYWWRTNPWRYMDLFEYLFSDEFH